MEDSIIISNTREMYKITPSQLLYIQADGNYSTFHWINYEPHLAHKPDKIVETIVVTQLGVINDKIEKMNKKTRESLVRIGRSHIINLNYLYRIDLTESILQLMDDSHNIHTVSDISRERLTELKNKLVK